MTAKVERFKKFKRAHDRAEELKEILWDEVERIFQYLLDKQTDLNDSRRSSKKHFIDLFDYYEGSTFDDFTVDDDGLRIHFYNFNDCDPGVYLAPIPLPYLESDKLLDEWFDSKVKEIEDEKNKEMALREEQRKDREYAEYKRLKDLYSEREEKEKKEEEEKQWWEPCPSCKWFDGYDLCARSENFGAIGEESKIKCKKEQLYTPKK